MLAVSWVTVWIVGDMYEFLTACISMLCSWKCICWQFANHVDKLPTVGNHPTGPPTLAYDFWHCAPKNWQADNSIWPDPNHFLYDPWLKKRHLPTFLTLTFDLDLQKISRFGSRPTSMSKIKFVSSTVLPVLMCDQPANQLINGTVGNVYGCAWLLMQFLCQGTVDLWSYIILIACITLSLSLAYTLKPI